MSYINDALRKAQLDKDSRYGQYGDVVIATASPRGNTPWKRLFIFVVIAGILIFFAAYAIEWGGLVDLIRPPAKPVKVTQQQPPPDIDALYRTALELQKKGQLDEAYRIYRNILSLRKTHAGALNNVGVIYMQQDRLVDALGMLNSAIEVDPGNADPYYNLACIEARMKNRLLSLEYLKKAIAINPVVKAWAREDHDLKNLRKNSEFKRMTR